MTRACQGKRVFYELTCAVAASAFAAAAPAEAQQSDERRSGEPVATAASSARDAFGERVGMNQVGLYSEAQTRGFDLMAGGGAFRVDGHYFHPAPIPSDSMVSGVSINVGVAAATLDLPSPTGVINYRLRAPAAANELSVSTGVRDLDTLGLEALGTLRTEDGKWALVAHGLAIPDEHRSTGESWSWTSFGAVGRWSPKPATSVRLFGVYQRPDYGGDLSVLPSGDGATPALVPRKRYSPDGANVSRRGYTYGALVDDRRGDWTFGLSAIRSERHTFMSDTTVIEVDRDGGVRGTLYREPDTDAWSNSYEVKAARSFGLLGASHRVGVALRQRNSFVGRTEAVAVPLGTFTLDQVPEIELPPMPSARRVGSDKVDQRIMSATYGLATGDTFELRLGAHRSVYEKAVLAFDRSRSERKQTSWLYSASAMWSPLPRLRLFASYVSGLEESGTAPAVATNRGEVLPPVEAMQYELGARFDFTPRLSLIASVFDIEKPIYGLAPSGIYAPVGTVRHRGIEGSLTGQVTSSTRLVLGANLLEPRVSGELVDAGQVLAMPPGVSRFNATLSVEQKLAPGWSSDLYVLYEGPRRRDSRTRTELRGVPWSVVGVRYDLQLARTPVTFRAQLINPIDFRGYYATPYGGLVPVGAQTYRLLATATF